MKSAEIREKFQKFFEARDHIRIPSASLIPNDDSTTLFTGSGMQPLVPYLLGQKHPLGNRLVNSQKSFRAEDIEEVGDNRHTTFFEMLGNWSLGDYFKEKQLPWFFEFLTKEIHLDPKNLYVSVFAGDERNAIPKDTESVEIWQKLFSEQGVDAKLVELGTEEQGHKLGMQGGRIFSYTNKNWWSRAGSPEQMPIGEPGGPDSEMFYDFGTEHDTKFGEFCHPNCDCGRFIEIGNSVFMEYIKTEKGFEKLKQRNVDFGGGLERITAASNHNPDVYKIDTFSPLIGKIQELSSQTNYYAERVIADHIKAAIFLIADGVIPSNKDRGYVLRQLIRRQVRYSHALTMRNDYDQFVNVIDELYGDFYSSIRNNKQIIFKELEKEYNKFIVTLKNGLKIIQELFRKEGNIDTFALNDNTLFDLYQSYGFPIELSLEEIGKERASRGLPAMGNHLRSNYIKRFQDSLLKHQDSSRTASAGQFKGGLASHSDKVVRLHTATHLLNAALREVFGDKVYQKGSNITEERSRFDFSFDRKLTDEEKQLVEGKVNNWILADLPVRKEMMSQDEAKKLGAIGVFGEKYGETVSIYSVYDPKSNIAVSREFCGGPHVEHTGVIGNFKIQKEEAVSAGVRRIKAVIE